MKQKIFLSILLMFSIFNFACFNASGTNENSINNPEETGTLAVHLSTAAGKTLLPDLDMEPASFTLTGSGPGGESFSVNSNQEMATITGLAIGEWTIQVDALNGESQGVGSGSGTVTVLGYQTVFLPITVTPYDGFGSLDITVRWNAGDTANPSIEAQLLPQSGAPVTPGFNITGGNTGTYTNSSLAAGYYTLTLSLTDTGVPVMGAVEIVRIVKDQATSGTFEFYELNKAVGDIQVDINTEMDDPITVAINGAQDTLYQGHSMNLEASVPADAGNVTYVWYLNGVSQSTGSSFAPGSDLAIGVYRVDVTAFTADGKRGGSAVHTFHVVEAPATKDITTFMFEAANNSGLPSDVSAVISGSSISAELPYGTDASALIASFLTTGETVTVGASIQTSGITANDFTSPVIYRVTAADSTQQDYSVTVTIALPSTPWTGIQQFGTASAEYARKTATDSAGNIYITGHTRGDLDGNTNNGASDIFLVKYAPAGTRIWTRQMGSTGEDYGYSVATDSADNVYITGFTKGGLDGNANSGDNDIFLVKYDSSGSKQWTRQMGTAADDRGYSMSVDNADNIYITGYTVGNLDGNVNAGALDIFLIKYNSSGSKQWTRQMGTASIDVALKTVTNSAGDVFITGYSAGSLDGNTNAGSNDVFLMKYNSSGARDWTRMLGSTGSEGAQSILVNEDGIYVTGYTNGSLDGNTNIGNHDIFLAKYDLSGNKQWTRQIGSADYDSGRGIASDSSGNIYITGYAGGHLNGNTNSGGSDVFLVKYDPAGISQWTRLLGTTAADYGTGVTIDNTDNIYVTGYTNGGMGGNTNAGGSDIFLLKYLTTGELQ